MKNDLLKPNTEISKVHQLTSTAVMGAMATVLMFLEIPIPVMPWFIKLDLSELPALIAAFAIGPLSGVCVCLIKNLVNLINSYSAGIGELSNFILGCAFVIPAGLIYKANKTRKNAFLGALAGSAVMALVSIASNYFIVYPVYAALLMPMETIIEAYQKINPRVETLTDALVWFNMPFTFFKGMCCTAVTMAVYKYISPILKGKGGRGRTAEIK